MSIAEKKYFVSNGKTIEVHFSVLQKIENYMNKNEYSYLGSISVEIGHNISYTEALLHELDYRGFVSEVTQKEKNQLKFNG
jgi:hypothetical protein